MAKGGRIRHILAANVNSILDRVEDPAKMLRALLREMDEARVETESTLQSLGKEMTEMEADLETFRRSIAHLESEAEAALTDGDDDGARKALAEKHKKSEALVSTQKAHADVQSAANDLQENLRRLTEKREHAIAYLQDTTVAQEKKALGERYHTRASSQLHRTDETLERLECRIDRMTAQAEALGMGPAIDAPAQPMTPGEENRNLQIDEELQRLRERIA